MLVLLKKNHRDYTFESYALPFLEKNNLHGSFRTSITKKHRRKRRKRTILFKKNN